MTLRGTEVYAQTACDKYFGIGDQGDAMYYEWEDKVRLMMRIFNYSILFRSALQGHIHFIRRNLRFISSR